MGYGKRALQQLIMYYEGKMPDVGEDVLTEEHSMEISAEVMLQIFIAHQRDTLFLFYKNKVYKNIEAQNC